MVYRKVKIECYKSITVCDICGRNECLIFVCDICKRDICNACIIHKPNSRHLQICKECNLLGKKILQAENMEDKRIKEMNGKFNEAWKNIKNIVLNSSR